MMARVLVSIPKQAKRGEIVDIRVLISHPMESGQRHDESGAAIPRRIIKRFTCSWNGVEVLSVDLFPAIAANPFLSFSAVAMESGTVSMTWIDDDEVAQTEFSAITVT